jgi:hypothetical protein
MRASETGLDMSVRFWCCAGITTMSALVSAAFALAGLAGGSGNDIFAQYAASRSMAVLIGALAAVGLLSFEGVAASALVMSLVQGLDGIIGALAHDPGKTYGPFALAVANGTALLWLLRTPRISDDDAA